MAAFVPAGAPLASSLGAPDARRLRTAGRVAAVVAARPGGGARLAPPSRRGAAPSAPAMVVAVPSAVNPTPAFQHDDAGYMCVEGVRVRDIQDALGEEASPFYVYSKAQISANYAAYADALEGVDAIIGYAIKANNNKAVVKHLAGLGAGAVLVSGAELRLAMDAGMDTSRTVFNGNGKTPAELRAAVRSRCLINVDSEFDAAHIAAAARAEGLPASVLIRINPDVDPEVHAYVSTGLANSKFGIRNSHLQWFLDYISDAGDDVLRLAGVHSHLGSTIKKVSIFKDAADIMLGFVNKIRDGGGAPHLRYLNIGGGLGIDYERAGEQLPSPADLINTIRPQLVAGGLTVIMEPGRSLVGNAGALISRVIGVKTNGSTRFIVTDGSMSELIRPALYDAYMYIAATEPGGEAGVFDVVGPVCESSDFLGKGRSLPTPAEGSGLAVMDAGAYCHVMASNYNMKRLPTEVLVDGDEWRVVRKGQTYDDLMAGYDGLDI